MKISHSTKKAVSPPMQISELIQKLLDTPTDDLGQVLGEFDGWKWPRTDLHAWIKVLDRFDTIMEDIICDYDVDKIQVNVFTPSTKRAVVGVLRFWRLLLENSTNRKMFRSYDRLNSLLSCSDLDIVILALNVLLRPSQQYSAQPSVTHTLNISTPKLLALARRWPYVREYGIGLVDLASPKGSSAIEALPSEAREVNMSFYRVDHTVGYGPMAPPDKEKKMDLDVFESPATQTSPRRSAAVPPSTNSGAVNIHLDESVIASKSVMDVLADTVEVYSVPKEEKFELLSRIRAASALTKHHEADRVKLVIIRLLAIAIFGHTHPESQATLSLFLYEPDLVSHIAELLQIDKEIPIRVQTAAISSLDSLARYRSKNQEVLTAVNAGVNHGILLALLRKTVADVADPSSNLPQSFVDALLSFVAFIASHSSSGNMIVGAGLIPLLVQVIENKLPNRLAVLSKAMQIIDNVLYGFSNAFNIFCSSRGVELLVDRIEYEVDLGIEQCGDQAASYELGGSHGDLPVARSAALKHILRSVHRMMQSSGTSEGLRGLIDLSLLKSIKKIVEHRGLFGPNIFPIAVNVMATFVHNEPTSLAIIQEAKLPECFYKAIEAGLEPSIEVLQAIPNAIGALCLNEVGQAQISRRPSIIPSIFTVFTSERHIKVLLEKENAVLLGTAIDELVRHHPMLKAAVFDSLKSTIIKIEALGHAYEIPPDSRHWYQLMPMGTPASQADQDVAMEDVEALAAEPSTDVNMRPLDAIWSDGIQEDGDPESKHDNYIVSFIDILGRFLEGLFQHTPHCRDFVNLIDGLTRIGRLTALPCLPYDFSTNIASDSTVQAMRTMTDVSTDETLLHLAELVKASLEETKDFWENVDGTSKLLPLVDILPPQEEEANRKFRALVTLQIRITLLSDVFATAGYAHGRAAIALLQTLMSSISPQVIADMGTLHRAGVCEAMALNTSLISKGIVPKQASTSGSTTDRPFDQGLTPRLPAELDPENNVIMTPDLDPRITASLDEMAKSGVPRNQNAAALRHLMRHLPTSLAPFFQAMVKMFHLRRNPDAAQRKQIADSSKVLANIMIEHLKPIQFGDLSSRFAYYGLVFGLFRVFLFEERASTTILHTVQLVAFYKANGFDSIASVCQEMVSRIEEISQINADDRTVSHHQELAYASSGLKVALDLLKRTVSSKFLVDSAQTPVMITRDKEATDPDYFEPHNFLVKLRLAVLPLALRLWNSPSLTTLPLSNIKAIVQIVLEIANGENEETREETSTFDLGFSAQSGFLRPPGPDENRIQMLTDMGFPRSAVERALIRTNNNVSAATEILLSHPFPLPPDPEPEPAAADSAAEAEAGWAMQTTDNDEQEPAAEEDANKTPGPQESEAGPSTSGSTSGRPVGKTVEEWKKELDEAREPLKAGLSRQALRLIDQHVSLLFDLHGVFIRTSRSYRVQAVQDLIDDIKAFTPHAYDVKEQPLANRYRLLALVLSEAPSSLNQETREHLMEHLLSVLLLSSIAPGLPPRWLASHLLVTEALLTLATEPRSILLPKEGEPIVPEALFIGPDYKEAKSVLFEFCLKLLAAKDLPGDEFLSVLRIFVLLTRDYDTATQFVQREGLTFLFKRIRASAVIGSSSYIITILRHIIEDGSVLRQIMQRSIKRYFSQARTPAADLLMYTRNNNAIALRNPEVFIEVTRSLCKIEQPYSAPVVTLKAQSPEAADSSTKTHEGASSEMQVDHPPAAAQHSSMPPAFVENIVHLLITELINNMKTIHEAPPLGLAGQGFAPADPGIPQESNATAERNEDTPKADVNMSDLYDYECFLMQCLTELLFSYDSCKIAFLSYSSKKRTQTPAKEVPGKFRTGALQFLLNDLITFGTINANPDGRARNRMTLCSWAMSVVVALCVDTTHSHDTREMSSDLISVRKFVLEAVSRAIKDISPTEAVDARYGRLLAGADLCHRLLTVKFNSTTRKQPDENPTHIAKIMLEKNFVQTLTTALSEIDLNYPNVRSLVPSILRPLELLTKIAIKMSKPPGKTKDVTEGAKAESIASMESDEEESGTEEIEREETPDLYRTSALGMYGGEMEDTHYGAENEMDEEAEMDSDVDMDFGEETGSEDTSETDEGEDEDEMDDEAHESAESWEEGEEEEEDDLVENEDEDVEEHAEMDDGDEDEDEGEDMLWQDIRGEADGVILGEELEEDEGHTVPIQIIHDEDEGELASDEDYALDEPGGPIDFAEAFVNVTGNRDNIVVHPRRSDEDARVFTRGRNNASAPGPEATTHPLLLNSSAPTNGRHSINQFRGARQAQRLLGSGANDLIQTIETLIGGTTGIQFFQHVMSRGRGGGGPEAIRVDVPAGATVNLDRGYISHRRGPPYAASVRVDRAPNQQGERPARELEPLFTIQRWSQEVKILHGDFAPERTSKLANHVALALLPAAVETIKQAKLKEEQELARQAEAKAKAEIQAAEAETEEKTKADEATAQTSQEEDTAHGLGEPAPAGGSIPIQQDQAMETVVDVDTEMADVSVAQESAEPESGEAGTSNTASESASAAASTQRITVLIHGSPVDITDTGIDPTFLEALPDDMREEVLNQHVRDQQNARVERPADSQISAEFLDALPPEIRAEIIQQEAVQRQTTSGAPVDMDNATFIASLDPSLRQTILMEQDDGFIQTLPSHMLAEIGTFRENLHSLRASHPITRVIPAPQHPVRKFTPQHDAIQLLDKTGVAILTKLLFYPEVSRKTLLFKVLLNLCENARTRTELFNLLLNILQDGSGDLAAVDKSFAQLSFRNTKPQTPKSVGKQKAVSEYPIGISSSSHLEAVPELVSQRCLEALTYIVTSNELSSLFFLTEHELPAGLRRVTSKKGKGKEKQPPQTHYPIVLLLSLLDRQSILRTPAILESVVSLLSTVTRPLASLKDGKKSSPEVSTSATAQSSTQDQGSATVETASSQNPEQSTQTANQPEPSAPDQPASGNKDQDTSIEAVEEKILVANPPQIPHPVLRLIVNILTVGECSGKTFQQSLALIQHLSYLPDARDVIAQELRSKAQEFGHALSDDLDELSKTLQEPQGDALVSFVASNFSSPSSVQAKLLRVLKTIDYMYSPKTQGSPDAISSEDVEKVQAIYESFQFSGLWRRLGNCLSIIEDNPAIEHVATVLLPLIESLMVVCKYVGPKVSNAARALRVSASPRSPTTPRESMEDLFVTFTDSHRKILNLMVRNNPSLMSGSFSLLVHNPRVLDFDNKRNYFSQQLHRRPHGREHYGTLQLNVRRARVFEDSFQHLQRKTGEQIKYGKLSVRFYDEEGVDAGGVTREWFQILARQMFDPNNALFQPCAADKLTYQPNKDSWINPEHLSFFKFVGRVIGKAIYDGRLLDAYFARSLYRQMLGKPVDYRDVEWVDPEYYNSLCWILENDPTVLELTFSVEADEFGVNKIVPLKEGGETLQVTQENKREFVQLSAQYRLYSSIKNQIESFLTGFYEIIPKDLITIFNEQELELLISGTPDIDVDEWRAATEYNGYTSSDPNIVWWWRALKSFNRDERAKVLSFATGTSRVPLGGFTELQGVQGVQKFSIHKAYGASDRLPQAHTCFNQIDLPQYTSYEMLRQQLLLAINEGGEGFAFS